MTLGPKRCLGLLVQRTGKRIRNAFNYCKRVLRKKDAKEKREEGPPNIKLSRIYRTACSQLPLDKFCSWILFNFYKKRLDIYTFLTLLWPWTSVGREVDSSTLAFLQLATSPAIVLIFWWASLNRPSRNWQLTHISIRKVVKKLY